MNNLKMLWKMMEGNRALYIAAIIAVIFATIFSYVSPLIIRVTIDSIIGDKPLEIHPLLVSFISWLGGTELLRHHLWLMAVGLVFCTLIEGYFMYLKGKWSADTSENIARNLRDHLYDHLQRLPFSYHSKAETGDLIQRCTSDVETIRRFLSVQFIEVGRAIIMLAMVIPIMLAMDLKMTLVTLAFMPLIILFAVIFFIKIKNAFQDSDESEAELTTVLQENLTGIRVVRAFARQDFEISKFDTKNIKFRDLTYHLIVLLAYYWAISDFICMLQIVLVLVAGAYWASIGVISLGTLVVFITYLGKLLWPIRQMGRILTDMGKALVSINRVKEILVEPIELGTGINAAGKNRLNGNIAFENITFGYDPQTPVLKNISFSVKAGQTLALLGPTGSGKTTLISLLPRLYDYQHGSILIDGKELSSYDRYWLRKQIGIVMQEPFLFSKSIRDNIRLGRGNADETDVFDAARIASIHDVIQGFNHGYDTVVGERGVTLSGGQKQRVAIARAIIQEPAILIFDDSLSAVDTETEMKIQQALFNRQGKSTTIIISHRITTVAKADLILVLKNGEIIQQGNHETLIDEDGLYRRVWMMQSAYTDDSDYGKKEKNEVIINQKLPLYV